VIRRTFAGEALRAATDAREADVIASTADVDSYGEIVVPSGIDLSRYRANPVVLYGHSSWDMPVGSAKDVRVEDGKLRATVRFVDASASPLA